MDREQCSNGAELLKALGHPTRLMILRELLAGVKCVADIEDLLSSPQPHISRHLAVLRHAKLVDFAQDGALRCYYLARPRLVRDMLRLLARDDRPTKQTHAQIAARKRRK